MPESDRSFQGSGPSPSGTAYLQNETMLRDDTLTQKPAITDLVTSLTSRRLISKYAVCLQRNPVKFGFQVPPTFSRYVSTLSEATARTPHLKAGGGRDRSDENNNLLSFLVPARNLFLAAGFNPEYQSLEDRVMKHN